MYVRAARTRTHRLCAERRACACALLRRQTAARAPTDTCTPTETPGHARTGKGKAGSLAHAANAGGMDLGEFTHAVRHTLRLTGDVSDVQARACGPHGSTGAGTG
jgi:hypothetical protein